jgi:Tetratricopeptide repeat
MRVGVPFCCRFTGLTCALFLVAASVHAQGHSCTPTAPHDATPAEEAYAQGKYDAAESLYMQALQQKPHDVALSSALVRTLLRQGKVNDAEAQANKALADDPNSAAALTALAEVQFRKGQPWLALQTLSEAAKADFCYARAHLIRSRILRIDSMYASERKELQTAYDIDPTDPDIKHTWLQIDSPANDIEGTEKALSTMSNVDADLREKAMASVHGLMGQLTENSQTCKSSPITAAITLPLMPVLQDAKHITGYQLEVQLPQRKAKLIVDTAASGLYISRALADENGFEHAVGEPANTVHVDNVRIGPLEFRDCMVGVSDTPFPDKGDGFIGTDVFASYLVTLDYPVGKLELAPLPPLPGAREDALPVDRQIVPEMQGYAPVYHRQQFLLVPVVLNSREKRLFVLDSGMRMSTMTSDVAHLISSTKVNFTNIIPTVSGGSVRLYRDSFDFHFANLSLDNQGHIIEFDPAAIDEGAGFQVAGLIGFDMLHALTVHLDYRDGLVKFDQSGSSAPAGRGASIAVSSVPNNNTVQSGACDRYVNQAEDLPTNETIEAQIVGWLDSGHTKPGQPITLKVVHEWIAEECRLPAGAMLYGNVLVSSGGKGGGELALMFDHGDCFSHSRKELSLRIIGVVGPAQERKAAHDAMPAKVAGGARDISVTVANMGMREDENLNPGGPPNTVHPGIVVGLKGIKMTPEAGPQCSALMTSAEHSVRLDTGSEFILTMEKTTQ